MIIILGAGLTGLSAAYHLRRSGCRDVAIFERERRPCGLARSMQVGPYTFDYTGHFLHLRDPAIKNLATRWMGKNLPSVVRSSWIFSHGVYTRYPFQTNTYGLPIDVVKECVLGYIQARYENVETPDDHATYHRQTPRPKQNFEHWIYKSFGPGIAKHFMIPYNDKLWGIHPRDMSSEWMGRFVPPAPIEDVVQGALTDATANVGYNATFRYPAHGGIESFGQELAHRAGTIHLGDEVIEIDTRTQRMVFASGRTIEYEAAISTLPLPELCARLKHLPKSVEEAAANLRWSSVFALNLGIRKDLTEGRHWVYIPERKFGFYRAGCFSNAAASMAPEGHSSVWVEFSHNEYRPIDRKHARQDAIKGLKAMGWLHNQRDITVEWPLDIRYAYVTFDAHHAKATKFIHRYLKKHNITSTGRYGSWEYSSMEDAILHGRVAAQRFLGMDSLAPDRTIDIK